MGILRHSYAAQQSAIVPVHSSPLASRYWPLRRRSLLEIGGLFFLVVLAAVLEVSMKTAGLDANTSQGKNSSVNLQVTHSSSTPGASSSTSTTTGQTSVTSPDAATTPPTPQTTNQSSSSSSTSVTTSLNSSNQNGTTTTTMTVNGQPVSVPTNGSTSFTTPDGTNVSASNSSDNNSGDNSTTENVTVNVSN
jgi:hypothetical protein